LFWKILKITKTLNFEPEFKYSGGVSPPSPKRRAEREQRGGIGVKVSPLLLVFLTLTVVAYNYQFYNIPCSMWLNAHKLQFPMLTPSEYVDVTEDTKFCVQVFDYVRACDIIRTGMKIEEHDLPYEWLKNASNSSENYDMIIKYFDDYYFLQVRYYPDFKRTPIEHGILWTINIATITAWLYFILTETPLKKWIIKVEGRK
jgi:hypothetical protein